MNRKTGADVGWSFIDRGTGEPISAMDLSIEAGPGADDLIHWRLSHAERRHKIDDTPVSSSDAAPVKQPRQGASLKPAPRQCPAIPLRGQVDFRPAAS
ncbi:hypothetical protein [Pseudomonas gingeri]|uniref:hypothetical protein n=1 Tax=Pseudomonas gingeri TaxID=117681 RepID=UPI001C432E74|nr:hypothetical protein [Pseudomonas gingeri]